MVIALQTILKEKQCGFIEAEIEIMEKLFKKNKLTASILAVTTAWTPLGLYADDMTLEEVIVTATRRAQSVQEVPYNISAFTGDSLAERGISDAASLFNSVPGVSFIDFGARNGVNNSNLIIRGINSTDLARNAGPLSTAPVVSTYVNETPIFVNLRLKDIERIEVLRGPQGTLYGSGSLGGSVRYIFNKPDFENPSAELSAGISNTKNGDGLNYETDIVLNFPISDTFAVRFSAGYEDSAGFVDQAAVYIRNPDGTPVLANGSTDPFGDAENFAAGVGVFERIEGSNAEDSNGFRIAARWQPIDAADIILTYQQQANNSSGTQMISPALFGSSSLTNGSPIAEPFESDVDLIALEAEFDLGFASFSSSASTYNSSGMGLRDMSGFYETAIDFDNSYYGTNPRPLVEDLSAFDEKGSVFEARLASQSEGSVDWIVGLFYMDQETDNTIEQTYFGYDDFSQACFISGGASCGFGTAFFGGPDPVSIPPLTITSENRDLAYISNQNNDFRDLAFFGEVTWHVNDNWQITGGLRYFDQKYTTNQVGGLVYAFEISDRTITTEETGTLFKLNTSYAINDSTNVYAVWSEGFRRAGANGLPSTVFGNPVNSKAFTYTSDTTDNIELGVKGDVGVFRYTIAYFDVTWDDIQTNASCTSLSLLCVVNAGEASSKGVEVEFQGYLTDNLNVSVGYSYTKTELERLSDDLIEFNNDGTLFLDIVEGAELPGTNKHQLSLNTNYFQELSSNKQIVYGLNGSYRSSAQSAIDVTSVELDGFWLWNANIALKTDSWSVTAFINNINDERGLIAADSPLVFGPTANAVITRPRTFGLRFTYHFQSGI